MSNYKCPHCGKIAWKEPCNHCGGKYDFGSPGNWSWENTEESAGIVIEWIDDNDGFGPRRLSRPVRCF
jgi:hypothetical protein